MDDEAKLLMEDLIKVLRDRYPGWEFNVEFYALKRGEAEFHFRNQSSLLNLEELYLKIEELEEEKKDGKV